MDREFEGAPRLVIDPKWPVPKLSNDQAIKYRKQLAKVRDKPRTGERKKIAVGIVMKKLNLMAGNGVDSTYPPLNRPRCTKVIKIIRLITTDHNS